MPHQAPQEGMSLAVTAQEGAPASSAVLVSTRAGEPSAVEQAARSASTAQAIAVFVVE
jgi:hypothetical protein